MNRDQRSRKRAGDRTIEAAAGGGGGHRSQVHRVRGSPERDGPPPAGVRGEPSSHTQRRGSEKAVNWPETTQPIWAAYKGAWGLILRAKSVSPRPPFPRHSPSSPHQCDLKTSERHPASPSFHLVKMQVRLERLV